MLVVLVLVLALRVLALRVLALRVLAQARVVRRTRSLHSCSCRSPARARRLAATLRLARLEINLPVQASPPPTPSSPS
jgi:hypothetical protein